jgi:integrase
VTGDVLAKMLATCQGDGLRDVRDRAVLMVGFASGGRRRSEIAGLRVEQLTAEEPVLVPTAAPSPPCPFISAGRKHQAPITTRSSISPAGRSMR